jgi:DNA polymerase-3 subunit gamma/tau
MLMTHQVLALKLRPQNFDEVVGQDSIIKTLKNAIESNRIPHAFIFSGIRGVGKTSTARILAKALNCKEGPTPKPCNKCTNCKEISLGSSVDVFELDAASNRGIDEIRDIRSKVKYPPLVSKYKIYILDEAHMLTTQAFNALLKTLEEPPPYIIFILSTTEFHKLPATIISRCQHFDFRRISHHLILDHLRTIIEEEHIEADDVSLALIATASEGSLRDAQRSLDQIISYSGKKILYDDVVSILGIISNEMLLSITQAIMSQKGDELIKLTDKLINYGYEPHQICHQLIGHLRNLLLFKVVDAPEEMISLPKEDYEKLQHQAASFSKPEILRLLDMILNEEKEIRYSSQSRFQLESLLIRMSLLKSLLPVDELISKLENFTGKLSSSANIKKEEKLTSTAQQQIDEPDLFSNSTSKTIIEQPAKSTKTLPQQKEIGVEESGDHYQIPPQDSNLKDTILNTIKQEKPQVYHLMNFADSINLKNNTLTLNFSQKNGMHKELLEEKSTIKSLKQLASKIAQREIEIKIVTSAEEKKELEQRAEVNPEEESKKRLEKQVLSQPRVKDLIDTFKGKITHIEDLQDKK